eukprot:TRINITY_DN4936_c0_g1_i1.p1 TRINITY_DN4936_c0_g1~~TRINITY_DN4936_c0_g1_i1.p1  ORF type:complete len:108 (+),score=3.12 TRINITY_DN4936_c0_g1_i1:333-656(+)
MCPCHIWHYSSLALSYLPPIGFAAAITEHRALRDVTIPAFDMLMLCCSMASCILALSRSFMLSNSSMRQMPLSARTRARHCKVHAPVIGSLPTATDSPAAEEPFPAV